MTQAIAELTASLRELDPDTPVPLPRVSRAVGWAPDAQTRAIQAGAVDPLPIPPAGRRGYFVSRDEAFTILAAAVLAFAAGVAVVVMIRAIKATGLDPDQLLPA